MDSKSKTNQAKIGQPSVICFGETLWDMLPSGKRPGGAPMNTAYHLNNLGISASIIGRVGKDILGDELLKWMREKKIPTAFMQADEENKTGKVIPRMDDQQISYDILRPAAWDFIEFEEELLERVRQSEYFIFGSLAARGTISRKTLYRLLKTPSRKILDINLRSPHFNVKRIEFLLDHADIVKLNSSELDLISSWYEWPLEEKKQMKELQTRFSIQTVITTRGEGGAAVLDGREWLEMSSFKVEVKDTIGSGDAFLAGFLYQTILGADLPKRLSFACALGAFVAMHEGACPDYSVQDIEQIMCAEG
jgi:fructokinase